MYEIVMNTVSASQCKSRDPYIEAHHSAGSGAGILLGLSAIICRTLASACFVSTVFQNFAGPSLGSCRSCCLERAKSVSRAPHDECLDVVSQTMSPLITTLPFRLSFIHYYWIDSLPLTSSSSKTCHFRHSHH